MNINWDNRQQVLQAVTNKGYLLRHASPELQANRNVVMAAVTNTGHALLYASPELQANRNVVMAAVRNNGRALEYASDGLRNNREIVLRAVMNNGHALRYASEELRNNYRFMSNVVRETGNEMLLYWYGSETVKREYELQKRLATGIYNQSNRRAPGSTRRMMIPQAKKLIFSMTNKYPGIIPPPPPLRGGVKYNTNKFINIPKIGKRKVRYYKNGKPYVLVKGKKVKI